MLENTKEIKPLETTVERYETISDGEVSAKVIQQPAAMGTVTITDTKDIFLVPAPSADPRGISYLVM